MSCNLKVWTALASVFRTALASVFPSVTAERFQVARLDQALVRSAAVGVWRRTLRALGMDVERILMAQVLALARRHSLAAQG